MSIRRCFRGKVKAGMVSERAGRQIETMLDAFEHQARLGDAAGERQAVLEAAAVARGEAARRADAARRSAIAQANVLRAVEAYRTKVEELRAMPGDWGVGNKAPPGLGKDTQTTAGFAIRSLLARDPYEIATWANVDTLTRTIRGQAHALFADAIETLRPKGLGFAPETSRELDVLRALYDRTDVDPQARAAAEAWNRVAGSLADQFIDAGGNLAKRERWRLPNPQLDPTKVRAAGVDRFRAFARERVDRDQTIDWATGERMTDARFEVLLDEAVAAIFAGGIDGPPSAAPRGRKSLANSRDAARFFVWRDAEAWAEVAEAFGEHQSVYETMVAHIHTMSEDIAMMRVLGPNPDATMRFALDVLAREPARLAVTAPAGADEAALAKAAKQNRRIAARGAAEARAVENLYAEVSGANRSPVHVEAARALADTRHLLVAGQLGSALISSITDAGTLLLAARFHGLPVMGTMQRAIEMMATPGAEVFAAQQGLVLDSLAHAAGQADRMMGETIRTGVASKLSNAVIRASGLRRWTGILRSAFGLEAMAHAARERGKSFADLDPAFREALGRHGIGAGDWDLMRSVEPGEPRPGAPLLRWQDIAAGDTPAHRQAADKWSRLLVTEMDYAVIEGDPLTRALLLGQSRPGTAGGEVRRSLAMYKQFPATFVTMHFARALARGWDGSRLGHAALTFLAMMGLGALAMQAKEIAAGRDPLSLDPTTGKGARAWGKAILQGGGLGVFGDVLAVDQTKYGNSWAATAAGPVAGAAETIIGDFVIKNIQKAGKGEPSQFLGDAVYALGRHVPGSSLWYARLAFQRLVLDQAHLMADPRARERFGRIEQRARQDFGQDYWWRPGQTSPQRAPDLGAAFGQP